MPATGVLGLTAVATVDRDDQPYSKLDRYRMHTRVTLIAARPDKQSVK